MTFSIDDGGGGCNKNVFGKNAQGELGLILI